jgi:hypothetical protein
MELPAAQDLVGVCRVGDGRPVDDQPDSRGDASRELHWGGGVRWHTSSRDSVLLSYRFQHFSNGNQLSSNPGVNSHVLLAGWSRRSTR